MSDPNNITAHDCGENNSACTFAWLTYLILAIGCGILIFMMIAGATEIFGFEISRESMRVDIFSSTNFPIFEHASWWTLFALIMLILGFVETVIKTYSIEKTNINIISNNVYGRYVSKYFNIGAYCTKKFEISSNQIDNIKVSKNFVELHADNRTYRVYAKNPAGVKLALDSML